jgi:hypothetical protein
MAGSSKKQKTSEFESFERLTKKVLSVPKKDVDQAENGRKKRQNGRKPKA